MSDNNRTPPEDKDEHFQEKKCRTDNNKSITFWGLDPIKQRGARRKIKAKADSVEPITNYGHHETHTESREFESGQWPLDSLRNEVYLQLDSKWIKDKKNRLGKRKFRGHARSYIHPIPADDLEPFDISNSVLVMDIQEKRAGPEYYGRSVKKGLEQKNGVEKFEQFY